MPSPIVLTSYTQVASSGGFQANMCNTWYMVASNDGSSWVQLDSKSGYTWTASQLRTFTISNTTACSYYRIVITLVNGNELTFFGIFYNGYQQITNSVAVQGALGIGTTNPTNGEYLSVSGNSYFNGNVGIGTTTTTYSLDIYNSTASNNFVVRLQSGSGNGQLVLSPGLGSSLGYMSFMNNTGIQVGYVGYGINYANYIDLASQNGYLGYRTSGYLIVTSQLAVGANTLNSGLVMLVLVQLLQILILMLMVKFI